jgi:hypothetical protein
MAAAGAGAMAKNLLAQLTLGAGRPNYFAPRVNYVLTSLPVCSSTYRTN